MPEECVGLARQDGRLLAVVSLAGRDDEESEVRYALAHRRIEETKAVLGPGERRALDAWRDLGEARLDRAECLSAALIVLLETVPLGGKPNGSPMPDPRAWLCQRNVWAALREALRAQPARILSSLRRAGYGPEVESLPSAQDPYAAYHHGAIQGARLPALPPPFRAYVLPLLRSRPWRHVRRALALYWTLRLHQDDALLALAVRLLAKGHSHGLEWLALLAAEAPERRPAFARIVIESGALAGDPGCLPPDALETLAPCDAERYQDRLTHLLRAFGRGAGLAHLLGGFRVADAFAPEHQFAPGSRSRPIARRHASVPAHFESDLWAVLSHLSPTFTPENCCVFPVVLWRWSGATAARASILRRPTLLAWPPATTYGVLHLLVHGPTNGWPETERAGRNRTPAQTHSGDPSCEGTRRAGGAAGRGRR